MTGRLDMAKDTSKPPKNAAAAEARAKAQAQLRAQERKTRVVIWASVIIAIALFAGLVAFIVSQSQTVDLGDEDAVPANATEAGGFPVGTTGVVGEALPEGVPVVRVYYDYLCPVCAQFEEIVGDDLNALREEGTIRLEFHPVSILDRASPTQYSSRAANAAATVADGSPEHFLAFSQLLFENQQAEGGAHYTNAELAAFAVEVGVPQEVADTIASGKFRGWVTSATQQASIEGMQGTPTVMVEGEILDQNQVPYFQPGVLRSFLEALASQG
jgi:protein-disulfide isomerase